MIGMTDVGGEARPRVLSTVERAYELAREGPCGSVDDIRRQLDREGYASVSSHLGGPTLRKQLGTGDDSGGLNGRSSRSLRGSRLSARVAVTESRARISANCAGVSGA